MKKYEKSKIDIVQTRTIIGKSYFVFHFTIFLKFTEMICSYSFI